MHLKKGFVIFILLVFSVAVKAQKLNYTQKNVSLVRLFKEIKQQTGFSVAWNEKEFNVNQRIDISYKDADVKKVMDDISARLQLSYTIMGKAIIVKDKRLAAGISQTTNPKPANNPIPIVQERELFLQQVEIVSTGYQNIPKERATGSFALVDSAQLNRRVSPDIFSRLEGITSGLLFNKNTVNSNSGNLDLSIRGRSTIFANDQPLIILDNFPFNGDFNSINPNDVANITVLKDAAAASIWGVRAGNGVIVISTKRGKTGQALNISLNTNITVAGKPDVFYNPNHLSSSDFIDIETFLFNHGKYDAALTDQVNYPVVSPVVQILNKQRQGQSAAETEKQLNALRGNDIRNEELKYFYRKPVSQQYFLNASGGTAKSSHYFSLGYDKTLSSLVKNDNDRITINSQNTFRPIKNLEVEAGFNYTRIASRVDSTIAGTSGVSFLPYYQFKDANGNPTVFDVNFSADYKQQALTKGFLDWSYVPLAELEQSPVMSKNYDIRVNGALKYTIIPGLSAALKYQYQLLDNKSERYNSLETYQSRNLINQYSVLTSDRVSGYHIPLGGILYSANGKAVSNNLRAQLAYQKDLQNSAVSAILGYELSEFSSDISDHFDYGYDQKTGTSIPVDSTSTFNLNPLGTGKINTGVAPFGKLDRIRSVFANLAYSFNNKYVLSASARIDGSNYFGVKTNQKNVPLWSAGALWNVDRETFYNLNWLPILKIRASYGYNGNLDKSNTGITTFRYNGIGALYTGLPNAGILNIGNPELRWEKIGIANFGIDFGLKDQIVTGKLEYYFKNGTDILGDKAFASSTGIKTLRGNYSKMKANGIDVSLISQNLRGELKWTTNFLFSFVHDKVTSYDVIEPRSAYYVGTYSTKPVLGRPVYGIYSYKWAGLDPENGDPRGYLNDGISKNYSTIVNTTSINDLEYNGPARPTVFGGLNNIFTYCKFTMGINISYKLGYYFRKPSINYTNLYTGNMGFFMNRDYENRWQKTGDELITNVPSMASYTTDSFRDIFYNNSSATVAKGDHIRLQDVSLSYDLDQTNWKNIPFKKVQLYCYASNLGIIWKANDFGLDPDVIPLIKERLSNPLSKSFAFGLKANF